MRSIPRVVSVVALLLGVASCSSNKNDRPSEPTCTETNAVTVKFGTDAVDVPPAFTLKSTIAFAAIDRPESGQRGRSVSIAFGNYDLRDTLSSRSTVPFNNPEQPGEVAVVVEFHTDQTPSTFEQERDVYRKSPLLAGTYPAGFGATSKFFEIGVLAKGGGGSILTAGTAAVTVSTPTRVCGTFEAVNSTDGTKATGSFNVAVKDADK